MDGGKLFLLKPQTYMNLSGRSVLQLSAFFKIPDRTGTAPEGIEITKIQYVKASDRSGEFKGTFDAAKHVGKDYIELGVEIKAKPGYSFDRPAVWCNGELSTGRVDRGDGKYVYVFPLVIAEGFDNPFVDVKESDYFYSAVAWAVMSGVTAGVDATHFGPNKTCTRAQAVSFIYRAAGSPDVPTLLFATAKILSSLS